MNVDSQHGYWFGSLQTWARQVYVSQVIVMRSKPAACAFGVVCARCSEHAIVTLSRPGDHRHGGRPLRKPRTA